MVHCAPCFGVCVSCHQPQVKIGLPSFQSEMLQPLRKFVTHFAAHFPMWKSINTRTSFLTSRSTKLKTKYDLKTNVIVGDGSGGGGGSAAVSTTAAAALVVSSISSPTTTLQTHFSSLFAAFRTHFLLIMY